MSPARRVMVYGATGFSGGSLASRLCRMGHDVVLAGRDAGRLQAISAALGAPWRAFDLADTAAVRAALAGIDVVVNAAGPMLDTAGPMISGSIGAGVHYLDLAGEWQVFDAALARGHEAAMAGVMLMPGIGFSIAVSDCLVAHAVKQAPDTVSLRIGVSMPGVMSRGTLKSVLRLLGRSVVVRRGGALRSVPAGELATHFNFGAGERMCMAMSWPDVVTAQLTTGVENIEAFLEAPLPLRLAYKASGVFAGAVGEPLMQAALAPLSAAWPAHPSASAQARAPNAIVVEAIDPWRCATRFGLRTLDGYSVTDATGPAIVGRVLDGEHRPGFQTPAGLFGPTLLDGLDCAWPYDASRTAAPAPRSNSVTDGLGRTR